MHELLIVDDEPLVRLELRTAVTWSLEGVGRIFEASQGRQALDLLSSHPDIDLVFLDLYMPVMDGFCFLSEVSALSAKPEVVVLSSHSDFSDVRIAFTSGASDYILKNDLSPDRLREVAIDAFARHASRARRGLPGQPDRADSSGLVRTFVESPLPAELDPLAAHFDTIVSSRFRVVYLMLGERLGSPSGEPSRLAALTAVIAAQVLEAHGAGSAFVQGPGEVVLLIGERQGVAPPDDPDFLRATDDIVLEISTRIETILNCRPQVFLSGIGRSLAEASNLYREAISSRQIHSRAVVRAIKHIAKHFIDPDLGLVQVSEYAEVTPAHLSTRFVAELGVTFRDYLAKARIDAAIELFKRTKLKVPEVAEEVGFANLETFYRVFKRVTGSSPGRYDLGENPPS